LAGRGQLGQQVRPYRVEPVKAGLHLRELAPVDLDRIRAGIPRLVTGSQALDERPGVIEAEAHGLQALDFLHEADVLLAVLPVTVGGPRRVEQPTRFVEPQRACRRPGARGEFTDPHVFDGKR
jgi:hypothetical protein